MTSLFRKIFPKRVLTRDELDFLKLITMVGYLMSADEPRTEATTDAMNRALRKMYLRRTKGVPGLDPDVQG